MGDTHPAALSNHTSTQQHAATKPRFIITGFGRFCGVAQNPTEQLVNWLQSKGCHTAAGQHDSQQHYCISSLDVLEVSADAVDSFMQKQQEMLVQQHASAPANGEGPQPVVLLHFGVDTQVRVAQRAAGGLGLAWLGLWPWHVLVVLQHSWVDVVGD